MGELEKIKDVAVTAVKEAGEMLLRHFKHLHSQEIRQKIELGHSSPVTDWDIKSNEIIKKYIHKNFPDHDILSEESEFEDNPSDWVWVIDPLDGTRNYINNKSLWGVLVGVFEQEIPKIAVLYAPLFDNLYTAVQGQGAYVNQEKLEVNKQSDLAHAVFSLGRGHDQKFVKISEVIIKILKPQIGELNISSSAVIELIRVASGEQAGTIMAGIKVWDVAAGVLLVREAGGRVTDLVGNEWGLKTRHLFASNGRIHQAVLEQIKQTRNDY